jgi:hypothetical protein
MPDSFIEPYTIYALREGAPGNHLYAIIITSEKYASRQEHLTLSALFLSNQFETRGIPTRLKLSKKSLEGRGLSSDLYVATDIIYPLPLGFLLAKLGRLSPQDEKAVKGLLKDWLDIN